MEAVEDPKDRIRRLAREWYWRNKERVRARKLGQCHEYRRRKRVGRPRREETAPERVMVFDTETGELRKVDVPPKEEEETEPKQERDTKKQAETKIEPGVFLIRFD
jgi:hypothetical protein